MTNTIFNNITINNIEQFFLRCVPGLNMTYSHIFKIFVENGIDIYISGGLMRDLTFSNVLDVDFSFTGSIEKIVEIAQKNMWQYSKRPNFPVIQIGDRKRCCLQGISTEYTLQAPIESLDFCVNHITYHFNTKTIIDRTGKSVDAAINKRLDIPIDDADKWLTNEVIGSIYNKIFRSWKMVGRGFVMEESLQSFIWSTTKTFLMQDREQFLKDMVFYLARDYGDYDSYKKGCALIMGNKWQSNIIAPMETEIISNFYAKEELWNIYTFNG